MKRFLYFWLGTFVMMIVLLLFAVVVASASAFVANRTNVWVGFGLMFIILSAIVAWWMTHTPRWVGTLAQKMMK